MPARTFFDVDPRTLRLPSSRWQGVDPLKLVRQFSRFGLSVVGMPPPHVSRDRDGLLALLDGVTRATRVAKYLPGKSVTVELTEEDPHTSYAGFPTIGDRLP